MPDVVSCIIQRDGKILLLQRSEDVGTYKGLWGGITGFVESDEIPLVTAYKEIFEEIGISKNDLEFKCHLEPISFTDIYRGRTYRWVVYPYIFLLKSDRLITLDWEHKQYLWIDPVDIDLYDTVPRLKDIIKKAFL